MLVLVLVLVYAGFFVFFVLQGTKLNTGFNIQANTLDLATSYIARLQLHKVICAIASITVITTILALWLKHRMKHISSRGPYLSQYKNGKLCSLSPYKSRNDTPIFTLVSFLAQSNSFFLHCFSS